MRDFDKVLYEGLLVAFGKILSQYNAFARESILKDVGREIVGYLNKHGYRFEETGGVEDLSRTIDLFVRNGFAERLEVEPAERGQRFIWHDLYLLDAYKELHDITENPFLSCPLNLCLLYLADKREKSMVLLKKTFDIDKRLTVCEYDIVSKPTDGTKTGFDSLVIENVRLCELAQARADRLETAQRDLKQYAAELLEAKHKAEQQSKLLQEQTQQTRLLAQAVESTAECISITDTSDHIVFVNEAFLRTYGYEEQELTGQHIGIIFPEGRREAAGEGTAKEDLLNCEAVNRRKGGAEFPVWLSTSAVRDEQNQPVAVVRVARDITESKQALAKLAEAQQRLVELSRQAGMAEVATGILHNVGNLMNSVNVSATIVANKIRQSRLGNLVSVVGMLRQHSDDIAAFTSSDAKGKKVLPYLVKLGDHLQDERQVMLGELELLSERISDIGNIVAAQQRYAKVSSLGEQFCIVSLVEDAFRIMQPAFEKGGICLERDFQEIPPLNNDRHQVLQILLNLLENATEAIRASGKPERLIRVRVRAEEENRVCVEVEDSGVGLPPENLVRIFAHGFAAKRDGHGFGLHFGALAARQMGGSLRAESAGLNRGATFVLELPLTMSVRAV
jgi:PAS domain S-box-containing protein